MANRGMFSVQLAAFAAKAKERANLVSRKVMFELATSLVEKSPVGDGKYWISKPPKGYVGGRFRANWQFGEGSINYATNTKVDPSGEATLGDLFAAIPEDATGKVMYITNSLPYAQRLEDGWSHRQAPVGMVKVTVAEFNAMVSKAISEAKQ